MTFRAVPTDDGRVSTDRKVFQVLARILADEGGAVAHACFVVVDVIETYVYVGISGNVNAVGAVAGEGDAFLICWALLALVWRVAELTWRANALSIVEEEGIVLEGVGEPIEGQKAAERAAAHARIIRQQSRDELEAKRLIVGVSSETRIANDRKEG